MFRPYGEPEEQGTGMLWMNRRTEKSRNDAKMEAAVGQQRQNR